jgi:hypothetical protein
MILFRRRRSGFPMATFTGHERETVKATGTEHCRRGWGSVCSASSRRPRKTFPFRFTLLILVSEGTVSPGVHIDTTGAASAWIARQLSLTVPRALPILRKDGMSKTMKRFAWMLVVALGASLVITGCGHKGAVSTSELQSNFKSAEPAMRTLVDNAVAAVKSNNYPEALSNLQLLSHKARLTPDQQQSLKDTIAAIQEKTSSTTNKPAAEPPKIPVGLEKLLGRPK